MRSKNRREMVARVAAAAACHRRNGGRIGIPCCSSSGTRGAGRRSIDDVTVTARRREEAVQEVPIPVSVLRGEP